MITIAMPLLLAAATASGAGAGLPSGNDIDGDGRDDKARVEMRGGSAWLYVDTTSAGPLMRELGEGEIPFRLDGEETRLKLKDVTGDGRPEILVAAQAAGRGLLYVLRYDAIDGVLRSAYADADAFASETGSFPDALAMDSKTRRVTVASLLHDETLGPREALFVFTWDTASEGFTLTSTTPAPADKTEKPDKVAPPEKKPK